MAGMPDASSEATPTRSLPKSVGFYACREVESFHRAASAVPSTVFFLDRVPAIEGP
jgi:hypothetical protein